MKKAQAPTFLIALIVAAVVLVTMIVFVRNLEASSGDILIDQTCKNSVKMHAASHIKGFDAALTNIKCPTKYVIVKEASDDAKKKAVADALFGCWNNFGEGKLELFSEPKIYCAICSVTEFKDKEPINDFTKYLIETDAPYNKGKYFDYLSAYSTKGAVKFEDLQKVAGLEAISQEKIDTNKRYAAIFVYAKGRDNLERLYELTAGNPGAFSVVGLGAAITLVGAKISMTGLGMKIGVPIMFVGLTITTAASLIDLITANNLDPDWIAVTVLREYKKEELVSLCDNLVT